MDLTNILTSTNKEYIKGTFEHLKTSINFNLTKMKDISNLLKQATKGVVDPVNKINSFCNKSIKKYKSKFFEMRGKIESKQQEMEEQIESKSEENEVPKLPTIIEQCGLGTDNDKMAELLEDVISVVGLFNNLFDSAEYDELVKKFHEIEKSNPDNNIINNMLVDDETESVQHSGSEDAGNKSKSNKKTNKKFLNKKKQRSNSESETNKSQNVRSNAKSSGKKKSKNKTEENNEDNSNNSNNEDEEEQTKKKRMGDEECTEKLKEVFNEKFKGITKTFLTRKLLKKVIWSNDFDFSQENPFESQREVIKSATYKYTKLTLNISEPQSNIRNIVKDLFKNYIIKSIETETEGNSHNNVIILAGEMNMELEEFIDKFKDKDFVKSYGIDSMKLDVFAFLEEIFIEFNLDEDNTEYSFSDEEVLAFKNDWETIQQMRAYWKKLKTNK